MTNNNSTVALIKEIVKIVKATKRRRRRKRNKGKEYLLQRQIQEALNTRAQYNIPGSFTGGPQKQISDAQALANLELSKLAIANASNNNNNSINDQIVSSLHNLRKDLAEQNNRLDEQHNNNLLMNSYIGYMGKAINDNMERIYSNRGFTDMKTHLPSTTVEDITPEYNPEYRPSLTPISEPIIALDEDEDNAISIPLHPESIIPQVTTEPQDTTELQDTLEHQTTTEIQVPTEIQEPTIIPETKPKIIPAIKPASKPVVVATKPKASEAKPKEPEAKAKVSEAKPKETDAKPKATEAKTTSSTEATSSKALNPILSFEDHVNNREKALQEYVSLGGKQKNNLRKKTAEEIEEMNKLIKEYIDARGTDVDTVLNTSSLKTVRNALSEHYDPQTPAPDKLSLLILDYNNLGGTADVSHFGVREVGKMIKYINSINSYIDEGYTTKANFLSAPDSATLQDIYENRMKAPKKK